MPTLTRRDLLRLPLAAPLATLAQTGAAKMNVLVIAVDDLNNRIGCFGDPVVKTPNIDRFARRAVRFDRAYCNYALCNPSRTSLLSGRRPETTRIWGNNTPPRTYLGNVAFLPEYFKSHGYFTARVGKIAHGLFEHQVSWDISESVAGVPYQAPASKPARAQDNPRPGAAAGEGGVPLSWTATNRTDEKEPDGATARRIVDIIEKNKTGGKPFFVGCGFHKPHLPWVAPKKYFDMYSVNEIKLPKTPGDDRDDIPPVALTHQPSDDKLTDLERRQMILAYHAATTFMDAQVGFVLDALDRNKLWDNTVVILFGDHGWHLYDHLQLWRKSTLFEESAHAPLIVYAPKKKAGVACPRLVEYVDIYPTLTELCGLPQAPGMEGLSFAPLLKDPQRPWKKAAYTMVQHGKDNLGHSVRTERYRYTEWNGGRDGVEFYDHETDLNEWTNLAWPKRSGGPGKSAVAMAEMKALLHADKSKNVP
jgi:iduronate 2-sulfatase